MAELHVGAGQTYATINAAIAAAVSGVDTIVVHSGTYAENVLITKSLDIIAIDGPAATSIVGTGIGGSTVRVANNVSDVLIGGPGQGFTIVGTPATNDGLETAAVYLTGDVNNIEIRNNVILANGEAAIVSEWQQGVTNITVDGNTIGGNTYDGAAPLPVGHTVSPTNPAGFGTSPNQWNSDNVARQLVTLGQGYSSGSNASNDGDNIVFTNNVITGKSGVGGVGNGLINIEADNSTISGNIFDNTSSTGAFELRVRGEGSDVTGNQMQGMKTIQVTTLADDVSGNTSGGDPIGVTYLGTSGNDTFVGGAGNDMFDGMAGSDTVDYSATTGGVVISTNTAFALNPDVDSIGTDELSSIENAIGGSGNDTFVGESGVANTFVGGAGNDIFNAGTGAGTDRFIYETAVAAESIATKGTNRLFVNGGAEGTDDLRNVEEIEFAGGVVVKVVNNNAAVYAVSDALAVSDTDGTDAGTVVHGSGLLANDINIDQDGTDQKAVVAQVIEGTYGTLEVFANGEYTYTLKVAADALSSEASETLNYNVTDGTNITPSSLVITITGTNDKPIITGEVAGAAFEAGSIDQTVTDTRFHPIMDLDSQIDMLVTANADDMAQSLIDVQALLGPNASKADAIAYIWDRLDEHYVEDGVVGGTAWTNENVARLSIEYARYIAEQGGAPLTDIIAKDAPVGRQQTLHDNLLGNLSSAALTQRWVNPTGYAANPTLLAEFLSTLSDPDLNYLLTRNYVSGNAGTDAAREAVWALDRANGFQPVNSGQLYASDADGNDLVWDAGTQPGTYGSLTLDADGKWTYTLDNLLAATQELEQGQVETDVFTVQVDDGHGGIGETTITITVTGANDAPTVNAAITPPVVDEDSAFSFAVPANAFADVDTGDGVTLTATLSDGSPLPPWITFDGTNFSGTPTNDNVGDLVITVTATDHFGGTTRQDFTLTVANTNDAPTFDFHQGFETDRDGVFDDTTPGWAGYGSVEVVTSLGSITAADGASFAVLKEPLPFGDDSGPFSRFGGYRDIFVDGLTAETKVYLDTDWTEGEGFSYAVAVNNSTTGEHLQDYVFNAVMTADGLRIGTGTGVDHHGPIIVPVDAFEIEDGGWYTLQHVFNNVGGELVVTFNVIDAANPGAGPVFSFDYATGQDIADVGGNRYAWYAHITAEAGIAVDDISLTGVDSGEATEDAGADSTVTLTGQLLFDDVDGDAIPGPVAVAPHDGGVGYYGNLIAVVSEDPDGASGGTITWTFVADDVDALAANKTVTQTYDLTVDDGHGGTATKTVTITLNGTNDAPIATAVVLPTLENGPNLTGFLAVIDAEGDDLTYTVDTGAAGFTLDTDTGAYAFDPTDAAYDGLADGETIDVVVSYSVTDGSASTSSTITFVVTGTNDTPVVTGVLNVDVNEGDGVVTLDALANATDVDGDALTVIPGTLPPGVTFVGEGLTIDFQTGYAEGGINGQEGWFDASPSAPSANIVNLDGNFVLQVANDPTLSDFGGPYSPGLSVTAGELGSGADVNQIEYSFKFKPVAGTPDGSRLELDIGNAEGTDRENFMVLEYFEDTLRIKQQSPGTVVDDWIETTLATDIDPTVFHTLRAVLTFGEGPNNDVIDYYLDDVLVGSGSTFENYRDWINPTHADVQDVNRLFFRTADFDTGAGDRQGFYIDDIKIGTPSFAFDANDAAYDHLAEGDSDVVTVNYQVSDGITTTDASATFTVHGTNDAPVAQDDAFEADEDGPEVNGAVIATDVDDHHDLTFSLVNPAPAGLEFRDDGTYSFDPSDAAYQSLADGEELEIIVDYKVVDDNDAEDFGTLVITITGTNDAPVVGISDLTGEVTEPLNLVSFPKTTGTIHATDDGGSVTYSPLYTSNEYGSFSVNPNSGKWTFTLGAGSAVQALGDGDHVDTPFTVTVTDSQGLQTSVDVVITIHGTNEQINGTSGDNILLGSDYGDTINAGDGDDTVYGNAGIDLINGGNGDDALYGGSGNDAVNGGAGDDHIEGGSGDDTIDAGTGDDHVLGGSGIDTIVGSSGDDYLDGGNGDDFIYGDGGADYILGGSGNDNLFGGAGGDQIIGGSGDDVLRGDEGADTLTGGDGMDEFRFVNADDSSRTGARDVITDFDWGVDKIDLSQFVSNTATGDTGFVFLGLGDSARKIEAGYLKYFHEDGRTYLIGGTDNANDDLGELLVVLNGNVTLTAESFTDGSLLATNPNIGTADDEIFYSGLGRDIFTSGDGHDIFVLGSVPQSRYGNENWDVITDFDSAKDKIDLSDMGTYHFLDNGSSSRNVAPDHLKWFEQAGNTFIVGDTTGDGLADFKIQLDDIGHNLTLDNFILI